MHRYLTKQLHPSVAVATCRKACFPQIVLLQYKAKPYLGFQNLGCHCAILGCHFDTQKRVKNTVLIKRNLRNCSFLDHDRDETWNFQFGGSQKWASRLVSKPRPRLETPHLETTPAILQKQISWPAHSHQKTTFWSLSTQEKILRLFNSKYHTGYIILLSGYRKVIQNKLLFMKIVL